MIEIINEIQSWFPEWINKIDKSLARQIKRERYKPSISEIKKRIALQYLQKRKKEKKGRTYKQLCAHKFNNLDEMDKILN